MPTVREPGPEEAPSEMVLAAGRRRSYRAKVSLGVHCSGLRAPGYGHWWMALRYQQWRWTEGCVVVVWRVGGDRGLHNNRHGGQWTLPIGVMDANLDVASLSRQYPNIPALQPGYNPHSSLCRGWGTSRGSEEPRPHRHWLTLQLTSHCREVKGVIQRDPFFSSRGPRHTHTHMQPSSLEYMYEGSTMSLCSQVSREQRTLASAWGMAQLGLPGQWRSSVPGGVEEGLRPMLVVSRPKLWHLPHPRVARGRLTRLTSVSMTQGRESWSSICHPDSRTCSFTVTLLCPHPITSRVPRCPSGAQSHSPRTQPWPLGRWGVWWFRAESWALRAEPALEGLRVSNAIFIYSRSCPSWGPRDSSISITF